MKTKMNPPRTERETGLKGRENFSHREYIVSERESL